MAWAKQKILDDKKTINEIAYELGFKYPAHFTRAFKKSTGLTPIEYRSIN
jgi:AraC-like DNA-binding protein